MLSLRVSLVLRRRDWTSRCSAVSRSQQGLRVPGVWLSHPALGPPLRASRWAHIHHPAALLGLWGRGSH